MLNGQIPPHPYRNGVAKTNPYKQKTRIPTSRKRLPRKRNHKIRKTNQPHRKQNQLPRRTRPQHLTNNKCKASGSAAPSGHPGDLIWRRSRIGMLRHAQPANYPIPAGMGWQNQTKRPKGLRPSKSTLKPENINEIQEIKEIIGSGNGNGNRSRLRDSGM